MNRTSRTQPSTRIYNDTDDGGQIGRTSLLLHCKPMICTSNLYRKQKSAAETHARNEYNL